jgi:hypothetical protein
MISAKVSRTRHTFWKNRRQSAVKKLRDLSAGTRFEQKKRQLGAVTRQV